MAVTDKLTPLAERMVHRFPAVSVIVEPKPGKFDTVVGVVRGFLTEGRFSRLVTQITDLFPLLRTIPTFEYIATILPREWVFDLADAAEVKRIYPNRLKYALQYPTVPPEAIFQTEHGAFRELVPFTSTYYTKRLIGADKAHQKGYFGSGVRVVVCDTGVDRRHPATSHMILDSVMAQVRDENGHGQWCCACVGGKYAEDTVLGRKVGRKIPTEGVAPRSTVVGIKCLGYLIGTGTDDAILKAIELAVHRYRADIISMSLGGRVEEAKQEDDPYYKVIKELTEYGIIFSVAAGNDGAEKTINTPGWLEDVLTVGAFDPITGKLADFSCLTGDTILFTSTGISPIRDVSGEVLSLHSDITVRPSKLQQKWITGIRKVYRLRAGCREIKATSNHPFLVARKFKTSKYNLKAFEVRWLPLCQIKKGDLVAVTNKVEYGTPYKLPKIPHGYNKPWKQPEETDEDIMWLLGLWIGDGTCNIRPGKFGEKGRVAFHIPRKDPIHQKIFEVMERFGILKRCHSYKDRVEVNSLAFAKLLRELGFHGHSHTKRVPAWVFSLPLKQRLAFIAGYLDSDGYVRKDGTPVFTSVNRELLEDIKLLCIISGLHPMGIYDQYKNGHVARLKDGRVIKLRKNSYTLVLNRYNVASIPTRSPIFAERLQKGNIELDGEIVFLPVESIEELGEELVYDFTVNPTGNAVANGFIVHNSRGPTPDGRIKPDCVAPGVNIHAPCTGLLDRAGDNTAVNNYSPLSGTSMATPHVSGLLALMREAHSKTIGRVLTTDEVKKMLEALGHEKNNEDGWGVITWDMYEMWMETQYGVRLR